MCGWRAVVDILASLLTFHKLVSKDEIENWDFFMFWKVKAQHQSTDTGTTWF